MNTLISTFNQTTRRLWYPRVVQVRLKNKKSYREPHIDEKLFRAAVEPVFRKNNAPLWDTCPRVKRADVFEVHPYFQILSREFADDLKNNRMMLIYQLNWIKEFDYKRTRNKLFHNGFYLRDYKEKIAKLTFENTKYATLLPLVNDQTVYIFSEKPNVKEILKLNKTMHQFVLLCGVIDGRLMSKDEISEYSELPSLTALRSQVVHTLNHFCTQITSTLSYDMRTLSSNLSQFANELAKK